MLKVETILKICQFGYQCNKNKILGGKKYERRSKFTWSK